MKWLSRLLVVFAVALAAGVPTVVHAQIDSGMVPLRTAITELNTLRTAYADAFNKKDVAALMATYDAEAVFIKGNGSVVVGAAAIKMMFVADAPTFPHLVITSDSLHVYGNTAVDNGTLTMHPSAGGELKERYLVVVRRGLAGWKLVRAISVPVAK